MKFFTRFVFVVLFAVLCCNLTACNPSSDRAARDASKSENTVTAAADSAVASAKPTASVQDPSADRAQSTKPESTPFSATESAVSDPRSAASSSGVGNASRPTVAKPSSSSKPTAAAQSEAVVSLFKNKKIKKVILLQRAYKTVDKKPVYADRFEQVRAITDKKSLSAILSRLSSESWTEIQEGRWAKLRPQRADQFALIFETESKNQIVLNLHYHSDSTVFLCRCSRNAAGRGLQQLCNSPKQRKEIQKSDSVAKHGGNAVGTI